MGGCDGGGGGACGCEGKEGGEGKGAGVGCAGMGDVCVGRGRREEEGGRERKGEETDSIEHQNSHKQSFFSGLDRYFHRIRKSCEMLLLVQTLS